MGHNAFTGFIILRSRRNTKLRKTGIMSLTKTEVTGWLENTHLGWGYSELLLQDMHKDHWCPYWTNNLLETLRLSACGQLFVHHRSHPNELGLDHRCCSSEVCKAREVGLHSICQLNPDKHCQCNCHSQHGETSHDPSKWRDTDIEVQSIRSAC